MAKTILIAVPGTRSEEATWQVLQSAVETISKLGFQIHIINASPRSVPISQTALALDAAGVLNLIPLEPNDEHRLNKAGIPFITTVNNYLDKDCFARKIAVRLTQVQIERLAQRGRRYIGFAHCQIGISPGITQLRAAVVGECTANYAVTYTGPMLVSNSAEDTPGDTLKFLRSHPTTDAFICSSDEVALKVMYALRQCGRMVPADISVIGIGNTSISGSTTPPMTTVEYGSETMGPALAFECLRQLGLYDTEPPDLLSGIQLVPRGSA